MAPPRPRLTHFLCIPLVTSISRAQLLTSLSAFRADVTQAEDRPRAAVPEASIRPIGTLHLTLGVMSLLTQERVDAAVALLSSSHLKELMSSAVTISNSKGQPLTQQPGKESEVTSVPLGLNLCGLKSMHDPSKTSILYAAPEDDDLRLQSFCTRLRDAFLEAGLLIDEPRPLLLHATIVNTVYVPETNGRRAASERGRKKLMLDTRDILQKYENFEWMTGARVEQIAICKMGAKKTEDGTEEYVVEGVVDMP